MTSTLAAPDAASAPPSAAAPIPWQKRLAPFKRPVVRKALIQLANTAIPFALGWYLMLRSLEVSYWITAALAVPMAGLYIRLFIFQHDCGHGSFLPWRRWNDAIGYVIGILTLTPYGYWKRTHAIHHATHGNLDRREFGDIETLTVKEYLARPWWGRLAYRLYRHPATLLLIAPTYQFALKQRLPFDTPLSWRREWRSVMLNNLGIAAVLLLAWRTIGLDRLFLVQGPIFLIGGALGIWLFFIQHQFEDTYWDHAEDWDYDRAGLDGSSFFDLHPVLHWLTGNIGYHHIHHLSSRIPNYRLAETQRAFPELDDVTKITVWQSLGCARLKLWDEESRRLVGFDHLRTLGAGA